MSSTLDNVALWAVVLAVGSAFAFGSTYFVGFAVVVVAFWSFFSSPPARLAVRIADHADDPLSQKNCRMPTAENPFMNPDLYDMLSADLIPMCRGSEVVALSKKLLDESNPGLYTSMFDVFDRNGGRLQFLTVPDPAFADFARNWFFKS